MGAERFLNGEGYNDLENNIDELEDRDEKEVIDDIKVLKTGEQIKLNIEEISRRQGASLDDDNLTYLEPQLLRDGKFAQKVAQTVLVRRHSDSKYLGMYISIRTWKRQRVSEDFVSQRSLNLDLAETKNLATYLRQSEAIAGEKEEAIVQLPIAEVLDNLSDEQRMTFANILKDLAHSRRFADLVVAGQLSTDTIDHLAAAVQQVKYKNDLNELRNMIDGTLTKVNRRGKEKSLTEHVYQDWFEKHTWVFGTEYIRRIDLRNIDVSATVDFILETADGFFDVLELKTPEASILTEDKSHNTWYFSSDVSKVIAQAAKYLKFIERNATNIESDMRVQNNMSVKLVRPRVRVVIGRSKDWTDAQKESFRRLCATLHNIELMTFDHVLHRAQQLINSYEHPTDLETVAVNPKED